MNHGGQKVQRQQPSGHHPLGNRVALVPYYPFGGWLQEVEDRKLIVDCTSEGMQFVDADTNVWVAKLKVAGLWPPFPCSDQLLVGVYGSGASSEDKWGLSEF
ncbi:hypothetical protein E2562_003390 [Oryza meyeriana var. granulata]|uniref:Uncharacterized protein n=1 Tax=Oryza meyeriana var. granulata TaxID=110450 RepID=A0A6G1EEK1_9ORYZ|nr:hypothetical protein E2562_003390 [Oryza meyeriana var. granulata]